MGAKKIIKKGSILDIIFVVIIVLSFAIGILITFKIIDEIDKEFQTSNAISKFDTDSRARTAMTDIKGTYANVIDNSFLLLVIGLSIGALALAFMVRFHPIFFVFFIIVFVIIIILSAVFSNIYLEMANNPELIALANQLTFITNVMRLLPFIVGVIGFLMAIIMYKTFQDGTQ